MVKNKRLEKEQITKVPLEIVAFRIEAIEEMEKENV